MLKFCLSLMVVCIMTARAQIVCPEESWTRWYDRDNPSGNGDYETLRELQNEHPGDGICWRPTIVEARLVRTKEPYDPDLPNLTVNPIIGFYCRNKVGLICKDYEARFCCPKMSKRCLSETGYPMNTKPFANENSCATFYQCANGYLWIQSCPSGLVFNPDEKVCDYVQNVPSCRVSEKRGGEQVPTITTTITTSTTKEPPITSPMCLDEDGKPATTLPFAKPDDCSHFYQCSNGYLYTFACAPSSLVFNSILGACDYPENVPGC